MMVHFKKIHKDGDEIVHSPLGSFPKSSSSRVLFIEDNPDDQEDMEALESMEEAIIPNETEIENLTITKYLGLWFSVDPFFPENKIVEFTSPNDLNESRSKCDECGKRGEVIEHQRKTLINQDKQIQSSTMVKMSQVKHLRSELKKAFDKVDESNNNVGKIATENAN